MLAIRSFCPGDWDLIDRSQATDFHLCPVFQTQPLTCRLTPGVKSAQVLQTALKSQPVFSLDCTVCNSFLYKMCTIEFNRGKALNCLQVKMGFFLPRPSVSFLFFFISLMQLPLAIRNLSLLYLTAAGCLRIAMEYQEKCNADKRFRWEGVVC